MNEAAELFDLDNIVTSQEFEDLIKMNLNAIWSYPEMVKKVRPILCHGSPGCGKSSIVEKVCNELGVEFIDVRLPQIEPCDIRGLPVPNKEDKVMEWYVNGTWPRNKDGKGIIFLDEITSTDRSIQAAAYELVLDRRLGNLYKVPDGYYIMAAGNTTSDRAIVTTMSSALANRFLHVDMKPDQESWLLWARQNNIHPAVIGFIRFKADALFCMDEHQNLAKGWPSPRSWEGVSQMCYICKENKNILEKAVFGLVGTGFGGEFMSFYDLNQNFDDVLEMMLDTNKSIAIPNQPDQIHALCSTMVYLLWRGKDQKEEQDRLSGFFRICMKLTPDFSAMAITAAMQGTEKSKQQHYCDTIAGHPMFNKWRETNSEAFSKHLKQQRGRFSLGFL